MGLCFSTILFWLWGVKAILGPLHDAVVFQKLSFDVTRHLTVEGAFDKILHEGDANV